ncbi:MAG TPA: septal ring lytic transglycosylase RlpA family protein [Steroidobacteraceae bacterium]
MKSTAKIRTVSSALLLLAVSGWNVSHAAPPASEGAAADRTVEGGAAPDREAGYVRRVQRLQPEAKPTLDRSGRTRVGKASFYAKMFAGRTMADGTRMEPTGDNAASRTLPLGTTAKVTNLETGKTAVVTIRDRGPYVAGRIVDLSPATAREIGLDKRTGVTKVKVAPIAVPLADGEIKFGDGVLQASNNLEESGGPGAGERMDMRVRTP